MISYIEKEKAFLIEGKNYSYAMFVNDAGYLQNLHYGGKIGREDIAYLIENTGKPFAPDLFDPNSDMNFDEMPGEYTFFGRGDYREPSAIIEREDGAAMSRFRYDSYEIHGGAHEIEDMPHVRGGGHTLVVKLRDDFSGAEIILNYIVIGDSDVLVRNAEIKNAGKATVTLKKAFSFCASLPAEHYNIMRLEGRWAAERSPEVTSLGKGTVRLQSLRGASSHQTNPFAAVMKKDCSETGGECYGVQLVYSGSWAITAEVNSRGSVRLQGGINDFAFSWELGAGESFITPQAALCYSAAGLGRLSREYARFIRKNVMPPAWVFARRPVVINSWEAAFFDFDNDKLFGLIDSSAAVGADTFVLDDGWFGKRDDDTSGLGDWYVNERKLKGGLKPIIERCKKNGLKFGLWFEPEMVSPDSDLYRAHPDWAVKREGVTPALGRNQLVLDFSRPEIVDYVFAAVSKILAENEISYVKWDMNRSLTEFYSAALPAHRQGEFCHRYILGVYKLAEKLTSAFPNVFFEGCAGGGGRFDAGMLYYFPQIWTSDNTDSFERARIQWGTSICYPLSAMSCHVSACPNHQTGRTTPLGSRYAVASLGAFGFELDLNRLSESEKAECARLIKEYGKIAELILRGDLYRLSNPFDGNLFCMSVVAEDKSQAYAVCMGLRGEPDSRGKIIKFDGLDENKLYYIEELGFKASGKALMNAGLRLPPLGDYQSAAFHISQV